MKYDKKVLISIMLGIVISIMTNVVAESLIDSKNVYYKDNSGLAVNNIQDAIDGTCTKFDNNLTNLKKELLNEMYPVGSIYISYNNTNPSSLFGGTWQNYGDGRVLKGISSGEAGKTGGSSTTTLTMSNLPAHTHTYDKVNANTGSHTLTIAEMPTHSHMLSPITDNGRVINGHMYEYPYTSTFGFVKNGGVNGGYTNDTGGNTGHTHPISTTSTPSGSAGSSSPTAISVEDPYITVYMWRRTA